MNENFIDELLREAEEREEKLSFEYADLLLLELKKLLSEISQNFETAEKEVEIIKEWAIKKNSKLQDRIDFLEKRLYKFILEQDKKTIDLANGVLRLRKGREKIVVEDPVKLLSLPYSEELVSHKEETIPNLTKIKEFINRSGKVPEGVRIIPGNEQEFSYKLKGENNNGKTETGS